MHGVKALRQKFPNDEPANPEGVFLERFKYAGDTIVHRYLTDNKNRKPN